MKAPEDIQVIDFTRVIDFYESEMVPVISVGLVRLPWTDTYCHAYSPLTVTRHRRSWASIFDWVCAGARSRIQQTQPTGPLQVVFLREMAE